ncbi:hypothetical protein HY546_01780 [archaeon]|nr:hypothetical protein [archaeon]
MHLKLDKKRYELNCHHLEHLAEKIGAKMLCTDAGDSIDIYLTGNEENVEKVKQKLRIFGAK